MNRELWIGLLVLIINTVISLVYFFFNLFLKKDTAGSYRMRFFVMLITPIVGPVFFFFGWLYYKLFMNDPVDLEDVVFSKDRVKTYRKADEARERNIVPMEEAMAVSDKASTRELMLDLVRKDIRESLSTIAKALNSEDSEVSHYAASVLQETLNSFRMSVQKLYQNVKVLSEEEGNGEEIVICAKELIRDLNAVLKQNVLSPMEQRTFVDQMEEMVELIEDYEKVDAEDYEALCMRLFDIRDYARCEEWCDVMKEEYPDILSSFTCRLKLYYTVHDRDRFFQVMKELKESNVIVDSETLKMIRTFS